MVRRTVDNQGPPCCWEAPFVIKYETDPPQKKSFKLVEAPLKEQSDTDDQEHVDAHATP